MGGASGSTISAQKGLVEQQKNLAGTAQNYANQLYGTTFPGVQVAENYYQKLASGDPKTLSTAIAPVTNQIKSNAAATKQNIQNTMPRGGEQNLAREMADINAQGQVGDATTKAYNAAPQALAQIGSQGVGMSISDIANAIQALSGSGQTLSNIGQEQSAAKASTMGGLGSLLGAGGTVGAAAIP